MKYVSQVILVNIAKKHTSKSDEKAQKARCFIYARASLGNGVMLGLWGKFTAEPRVNVAPGASELGFPSDDVDALYDAWAIKQLVVLQKPTDMDFGRTFVIQDPNGHRIRVYKLLGGQ